MNHTRSFVFLLSLTLIGAGCSDDTAPSADGSTADAGADAAGPLPSHCNPLNPDWCLLPWPSAFYLKADQSSTTGYRVAYPKAAMPRSADRKLSADKTEPGTHLDPTRFNLLDGFPVASQIVAYFKAGVSKEGLPDQQHMADSVTDSSPIWLLELPSARRVAFFAEVDANAGDDEAPGLLIHPAAPLSWNTRYAVVLRQGKLKDKTGQALSPPEPFRRIRDKAAISDPTLTAVAQQIDPLLDLLAAKQIPRASILLAWDFRTVSQGAVQGNLQGMVSEAMAKLPAGGPAVSDLTVKDLKTGEANASTTLREFRGKMAVPSFLASEAQNARLKLDASGKPVYRALQKFDFYGHIPRCAEKASGPLPVLIFGHGLFGRVGDEVRSGWFRAWQNRLCMVTVVTGWLGLSLDDLPFITKEVMTDDFSNLPLITDRLQQAQVNVHALVELMRGDFLKQAAMQVGGKAVTDGKTFYYLGISDGGIQGVTFAALNKVIRHYVFNVSAGVWSLMIQRSSNFDFLAFMLETRYPRSPDRLALVSLSQHLWDYTDPVNWAENVVQKPLSGQPAKQVILQEARHDDQVPNVATRVIARGLGVPQLSPVVAPVFGITAKSGPLPSAYVQFDPKPPVVPPGTNTPAPKPPSDKSAHYAVRKLEVFIKQLERFFKAGGQVEHTCSGICDPG